MTTDDLHEDPITPARFDALVAFLLARLDEDEAAARTALLDREFLPFESVTQTADHGARGAPAASRDRARGRPAARGSAGSTAATCYPAVAGQEVRRSAGTAAHGTTGRRSPRGPAEHAAHTRGAHG